MSLSWVFQALSKTVHSSLRELIRVLKFGLSGPACAGRCPTTKSLKKSKHQRYRKTTRSKIAAQQRRDNFDSDDQGGGGANQKRRRRREEAAAIAAADTTIDPLASRRRRTRCRSGSAAVAGGQSGLSRQARFVRALDISFLHLPLARASELHHQSLTPCLVISPS
jgi:hypothetical protein